LGKGGAAVVFPLPAERGEGKGKKPLRRQPMMKYPLKDAAISKFAFLG
jgi:hypothetical protein